jgi:hypothetical protein
MAARRGRPSARVLFADAGPVVVVSIGLLGRTPPVRDLDEVGARAAGSRPGDELIAVVGNGLTGRGSVLHQAQAPAIVHRVGRDPLVPALRLPVDADLTITWLGFAATASPGHERDADDNGRDRARREGGDQYG